MKYQTLESNVSTVFKTLSKNWVVVDISWGKDTYVNTNNKDYLYVFANPYIKGYGDKKYGKILPIE